MSPAWMDRAACAEKPYNGFTEWPVEAQLAVCRECPVRLQCLDFGSHFDEYRPDVVYGGMLPSQLPRQRGTRGPAPSATCRRGHPWTPETTERSGFTGRTCKICRRERDAAKRRGLNR